MNCMPALLELLDLLTLHIYEKDIVSGHLWYTSL